MLAKAAKQAKAGAHQFVDDGLTEMKTSDHAHAIRSFSSALNCPHISIATRCSTLLNRGMCFLSLKKFAEALGDFRSVLNLTPEPERSVHVLIAVCCDGLGNATEAVTQLSHVIRKCPGYADARLNRGQILLRTREPEAALEDFKAVARRQPRALAAHEGMGDALGLLGDLPSAEACHTRAVRLQPRLAGARLKRARVRMQLREFEAALRDLQVRPR
jgi:tetratricopeptide (TPR) repeat protein